MLFNSLPFALLAAPTILMGLTLRGRPRTWILLLASWAFYAGGQPKWLLLLWFSTILDYLIGRALDSTPDEQAVRRKLLLAASLIGNLGILFAYKYLPFVLSLMGLGGFAPAAYQGGFHFLGGVPAGLSFYTFQTLSYTIDVYRRKQTAIRSPVEFALFVAFFPQLIAGPVVRASEFFPQLYTPKPATEARLWRAVELFGVGLFKKVVVADNLGLLGDPLWRSADAQSGPTLAIGALIFWGQIYADFSAYSTMARGLGTGFGFDLPRNFNFPLLADGPLSYRRSWHMTMSAWFRDYVFHPLGGSRASAWRVAINIGIVWTLFGIWHGAGMTFLVWGLYNGVVQAGTREFYRRGYCIPAYPGKRLAGTALNLALMLPSAIVFRSASMQDAFTALWAVITLRDGGGVDSFTLGVAGLFAAMHIASYRWYREDVLERSPWVVRLVLLTGLIWVVVFLGAKGRPFVYFQF
ncbi:MAG: alginate O-acetyltransferase complex protein AlgI [Myxococcota bacterium]|jgi:alginate O-acetyltransferase complex protein AlgI